MSTRPLLLLTSLGLACSTAGGDVPTYHGQAKAILDTKCATCHQPGDIGPFPLTTYAEVTAFSTAVRASIEHGTMPPWQPSDDCNTYNGNFDLTPEEEALLLAWLDGEMPEGDPAESTASTEPEPEPSPVDLSLPLPEAYTPTREPDDYRCQLIPWPEDAEPFVTGIRILPDQRSLVHHVIVFVAGPEQAARFQAYDDAEEGPGYTCYGGPTAGGEESGLGLDGVSPGALLAALSEVGLSPADLQAGNATPDQLAALTEALGLGNSSALGGFRWVGSWVPGTPERPLPEGTGVHIEPGSVLIAQVHYNTLTASPVADRSTVQLSTAQAVDRQAEVMPFLDLGWVTNGMLGEPMTLPAGEAEVSHETISAYDGLLLRRSRSSLGLTDDDKMVVHLAGHHMHELGRRQRSEVRHADGSTTCLLDIPDWDFSWQGNYHLAQPATIAPGDSLWMGCTWDNSAANQPIVDGEALPVREVSWGEGTTDEMCLGVFYVTGE